MMLSQKILSVIKSSINNITQLSVRNLPTVSNVVRKNELEQQTNVVGKNKLEQQTNVVRRNEFEQQNKVSERTMSLLLKQRDSSNSIIGKSISEIDPFHAYFGIFRTDIEFTYTGLQEAWKKGIYKRQRELQRFIQTRYDILGPDISCANFIIFENGKVKFKGKDKWITMKEVRSKEYMVPNAFDPQYVLLEIDLSDVNLFYEGLENFKNLPRIHSASFARSPQFNDWFADKVSNLFPNLEFLDLSGNPKLTERGLEAFYRMTRLKTLVVTDYTKKAAFELSCMLLEDCVPGLKVQILEPEEVKIDGTQIK